MVKGDDNAVVVNMDGHKVTSDSLRWEDDDELTEVIGDDSSDDVPVLNKFLLFGHHSSQ